MWIIFSIWPRSFKVPQRFHDELLKITQLYFHIYRCQLSLILLKHFSSYLNKCVQYSLVMLFVLMVILSFQSRVACQTVK